MGNQKPYRKTSTRWLWGNWEGLCGVELKQKLLERMANSAEGQEKFWAYVKDRLPDTCWNWGGVIDERGYGKFCFTPKTGFRRKIFSHRVSYFLKHGSIDHSLMVCHHCDNRRCCNPDHLFLGTRAQNNYDMLAKGRQARGEEIGRQKLTVEKVKEILELHFYEGVNCAELGRRFNVTATNIHAVVERRTWAHVPFDRMDDPMF